MFARRRREINIYGTRETDYDVEVEDNDAKYNKASTMQEVVSN